METTDMNTTEYLRHRGWDEKQATETKIKTTEGHYVTPRFMMEAFADYKLEKATQQTTSQKQTIERLREALRESNTILEACSEKVGHPQYGLLDRIARNRDLLKQLLNTTEPKTEDELMEEKTDRNANVISSFMEHCKQNGFIIPDSWFESYLNA